MRDNERAITEGLKKAAAAGKISELSFGRPSFVCFNCGETHPESRITPEGNFILVKKSWGFNNVCQECENFLFDEAEKRDKRYNPRHVL